MPEDKHCKLVLQKKKKKKKKGKKNTALPECSETQLAAALPPETSPISLLPPQNLLLPKLRGTCKKECLTGSGRNSKKPHKESSSLLTTTQKTSGAQAQGCETELCVQAKESLRWEGVLQDPQAEAKRQEEYRSRRRQRYIAHREALLKEAQDALRQTILREQSEKGFV
ncbi:protein LIAT1 [Parambassis ranga]|uniref:Protein LIAT1 n=1 Tax=Parambassis ranga TaxID=210632 RepID=A0A6P7JM11_9TELE|nr:protein LIAT1 [Parambassis ranga]XP_028277832.1 protein LIAT1 [Parambassis ranga]XP_028277833.1 protein LIAT1 [Parambassis ranga]